jgi:hypothetical protein
MTSPGTDPTSSTTPGARGNPRHPTRPPDPHHAPKHHNSQPKLLVERLAPAIHYSRIRVRPTAPAIHLMFTFACELIPYGHIVKVTGSRPELTGVGSMRKNP